MNTEQCESYVQTGNRTSAIIDDTFIYVPNLALRMSGNSMSSLC